MLFCCVDGCSSHSDQGNEVSFHRFPKDPQLRKAWIVTLRRKNWTQYDTASICSKHFEEKYIRRYENRTYLMENAIPTLFPTYKAICKIKKIGCPSNVPANVNNEEPNDKTTNNEKLVYAIGFKITEDPLDSEYFPAEYEETTVTNIEKTENIQCSAQDQSVTQDQSLTQNPSSTQTPPTIVYTITSNGPEESIELLKEKLKDVRAENMKYKNELKTLQQKSRRLNKNIAEMEKFIYSYKEKNWISDASLQILKTIPAIDNELLALHLCLQQSHIPEGCLIDSNPCDNLSDINNDDSSLICISD